MPDLNDFNDLIDLINLFLPEASQRQGCDITPVRGSVGDATKPGNSAKSNRLSFGEALLWLQISVL